MVTPLSGHRVYLDTSAIIYAVEAPLLYPRLQPLLLEPLARGEIQAVTSWITLAEVLVRPLALRDPILEDAFRKILTPTPYLKILPVDPVIAAQAASLRASQGHKLPDALHLATGMVASCSLFLTGDARWGKSGLPVLEVAKLV